jgi:hypothetical protein
VHDGPPDADAGGEVGEVLDVEQRVRTAQCVVVDPGQVPRVVRREPERQRDQRPEEREPGGALGDLRREGEDEQQRRPFCEHHVLQQMRPEEGVVRERLELREEGGEDEQDAERSCGDTRPGDGPAAPGEQEPDRQGRREPDGLRRGMHLATVPSASRV